MYPSLTALATNLSDVETASLIAIGIGSIGLVASVPLGLDPDSTIFGNADAGNVKGAELLFERHDSVAPYQVITLDPEVNRTFAIWHVHVEELRAPAFYGLPSDVHDDMVVGSLDPIDVFDAHEQQPAIALERDTARHGRPLDAQLIEQRRELLGVPLLDHAEAAELALETVEVTMMVRVSSGEPGPSPIICNRHVFHAMHRKRELRDPRFSRELVLQIELR